MSLSNDVLGVLATYHIGDPMFQLTLTLVFWQPVDGEPVSSCFCHFGRN
jgi:hypothetical protein